VPKILVVAATSFEIAPILEHFKIDVGEGLGILYNQLDRFFLITGVGMVNTSYYLGRYLNDSFDIIVNAGVCGAFDREIPIGEVIEVFEDRISELGAEDALDFIPIEALNLSTTAKYHSKNTFDLSPIKDLKRVRGITVNTVHGDEASIRKVVALFHPDVESMEGAAFFRACEHLNSRCIQIRAVSNYVEKRNKNNWNMPLAIHNLNSFLITYLDSLAT
jgi:futalosine hydrolase